MDQLPRVIGPAPSERTFPEWVAFLIEERKRATREITLFQTGGSKTTYAQEVSALLKKSGISPEQLQRMIAERHDVLAS